MTFDLQKAGFKIDEDFYPDADTDEELAMFQYFTTSPFLQVKEDGGTGSLPSAYMFLMNNGKFISYNIDKRIVACYKSIISKIEEHIHNTAHNTSIHSASVLNYSKQNNNVSNSRQIQGLIKHCDYIDDKTHILTAVYTLLSSCCLNGMYRMLK